MKNVWDVAATMVIAFLIIVAYRLQEQNDRLSRANMRYATFQNRLVRCYNENDTKPKIEACMWRTVK